MLYESSSSALRMLSGMMREKSPLHQSPLAPPCFCVVKCFLEGRGELESVVEFVDGDEGSESLACFFGGGLEFFRSEASFDVVVTGVVFDTFFVEYRDESFKAGVVEFVVCDALLVFAGVIRIGVLLGSCVV